MDGAPAPVGTSVPADGTRHKQGVEVRTVAATGFSLSRTDRRFVYVTGLVLWISGAAGWALHQFARTIGEFGPQPHALEHPAMIVHGIAASLALLAIGLVWIPHVRRAWRSRSNRGLGALMVATLGVLVITGWGLYYLGGDALRGASSLVHAGIGLLAPAIAIAHVAVGRRLRRSTAARDGG